VSAAHDPYVLPEGLPVPEDDGAADHLPGLELPSLVLASSQGPVDVRDFVVLYVYPRSGRPGVPMLPGWDEIPGARGCTRSRARSATTRPSWEALGARVGGAVGADARGTRASSRSATGCRSR
jgi:hypothetical protein